jgi:hypothetical protein
MELTGASFRDAKRSVFAIIGRHDDPPARWQVERDRRDTALARLWWAGALPLIDAQLVEAKQRLTLGDASEDVGEFIGSLTRIASWHRNLSGAKLLDAFRRFDGFDPKTTRELIARAIEDETEVKEWATCLVRLLEAAEMQFQGVAA